MKFTRIASAVMSAAVAVSCAVMPGAANYDICAADTFTVNNPVIWSDVPDVDVIRVGDTYYMASTTMFFSPGVPIMKSKDLASWEICSYVYDKLADAPKQNLEKGEHDYSHGSWAASLRYNKGTFYVFFGSYGTGKSYIYKTNDIESGNWTKSEINGMYHDASMLFDDDGRNYLVYGGGGEIKIKELNEEMTDFKWGGVEKTLFKTGLDGLAGEGSHIQKIGDYYYVFVIAWPSGSGRIELCYRSKELTGFYEGKTVLNSGVGSYGSGAAQGGIVDTPDGKWYGMIFQDHGSVGRIPVIAPVTWQDGWPMMGVNGKVPVTIELEGTYTGANLAKSDDFNYSSDKLALEWQWNHNPDDKSWSVTERDGYLRLKNNNIATNLMNARNTLTMRTEGPSCSSFIKMDVSNMKPGDHAGLSAFQFNYGNVGVRVGDDGSRKIYMAKNGGYSGNAAITDSRDNIIEEVPLSQDEVYVKVDFKFNDVKDDMSASNNIDKASFFYSLDGNSWTKIGEDLGMTYDLKMFTGYRSGIYSYPTKTTGGYVDVDFFDYQRTYDWNIAAPPVEPDENGYYFHDTFEDRHNWTGRGGAKISIDSNNAYEGSNALLISDRSASWHGATKKLNSGFKGGNDYSFSANFMYNDGPAAVDFRFTLQYTNAEGEVEYAHIDEQTAKAGDYVQLYNPNFSIPEGAKDMYLIVETAEDEEVSFFVDDIIGAVGGTEIEGAGSGVIIEYADKGDIDADGDVDLYDLIAMKHGMIADFGSAVAEYSADVDGNNVINALDVVMLKKYIFGEIDEF